MDETVPGDFVSRLLLSLDSNLRCGICRDFFRAPMLLVTCSHTFCSRCIRESLSSTPKCPVCRVDAHEGSLKKNSIIDSIVACWTLARPDLLAIQNQSLAVASSSKLPTISRKKRSHSSSSLDLTLDDAKDDVDSKRTRYGTRANSGNRNSATASTSKRDSKGKGKLKREESDHEPDLASSDVEIVEIKSKFVDPTDPNIKVECPSCTVTMTNAQLNRHLDSGCDGIARKVPEVAKVWSHLMGTQAPKATQGTNGKRKESVRTSKKEKGKESQQPAVETKIALLNYSGMTLRNLKEHLEDIGLSTAVPDGATALDYLKRRHRQFALLHNANLDFSDPLDARRHSRKQLEQDLREWEVLQDAVKPGAGSKTVKNAGKWESQHAKQFKELTEAARASHEANKAKKANASASTSAIALVQVAPESEGEEQIDEPAQEAPRAATTSTLDANSSLSRPPSSIQRSSEPQYNAAPPQRIPSDSPSPPFPASKFLANRYSVALAQKEAETAARRKENLSRVEKRELSPFDPEGPKPSQRERIEYFEQEDEEEDSSMDTSATSIG